MMLILEIAAGVFLGGAALWLIGTVASAIIDLNT
jgi:hypothetical protein